jgi:polyphosphate kinase
MPRNLDRRVEAVVPVADPDLKWEIERFLELELVDDTLAWELAGDGTWSKASAPDSGDQIDRSRRHARGVTAQEQMQRATLGMVVHEGVQAV